MFSMKRATYGLFLLGCAAIATTTSIPSASAQRKQTQRSAPARRLKPGEIDTKFSRVYIFVDKTGFGHEHAVEGKIKSGSLELGDNSEAGEIVFDMASFTADTARARKYLRLEGATPASTQEKVTANMRGPDVLHVQKYPTAVFQIDSAKLLPKQSSRRSKSTPAYPRYQLDGKFTLHGRSRPLRVVAVAMGERNGMEHLRGRFQLVQSQFGISPYSTALGAIGVADTLSVWGDLWVVRDASLAEGSKADQRR